MFIPDTEARLKGEIRGIVNVIRDVQEMASYDKTRKVHRVPASDWQRLSKSAKLAKRFLEKLEAEQKT